MTIFLRARDVKEYIELLEEMVLSMNQDLKETPNAYNPKYMEYPTIYADWETYKYPEWVYEAEIKQIRPGWPLSCGNYDYCLNIII